MNDLYLSQDVVYDMESTRKDVKLSVNDENREAVLDNMTNIVGEHLAGIQNEKVAKDVVREYRNFVKATEAAAADKGNGWTEEQTALWNRVVSPYEGNMLFLDFWGMGCGPCRSGMIAQKKRVEELKDEKVKFLYIATEDEKPSAEKWMDENGIKGEHVYITGNEWKQFEAMINFTAIPRGVLVGKDGKIIESDFSVGHYSTRELKAFIDRF